jgi:hypothetical protein
MEDEPAMANLKVLLWFDTEDYITREADDALLGLLNVLDKRGIPGIFKIVGEKARVLEARGRTDILNKLKRHEVGFHTNDHSIHPTVSEYAEPFGFQAGAAEFARREGCGLEDLTRITAMKSKSYGQAGYSWAPQAYPVLKKWDIPVYLDVHDQVTLNKQPFWYGGLLHLTDIPGIMRMDLKENGYEEGVKKYDRLYAQMAEQPIGLVSIYYHPCEFSCTEFWDGVNFRRGQNTPREQWKPAALRPPGEMEYYLDMLGRFIDYTLSQPGVEYITAEQVLSMESSDSRPLEAGDIIQLAKGTAEELTYTIYNNHSLSASDLHSLFCRYLLGQELKPELIYGPENEAKSDPVEVIQVSDLKKAIAAEYPQVLGFKQLPDTFQVGGHRISPLDLTCTMAQVIANGLGDGDSVKVSRGVLKAKAHAKDNEYWGPKWSPFPQDLRVPNLIRMSKLQTWTLKPAIFH